MEASLIAENLKKNTSKEVLLKDLHMAIFKLEEPWMFKRFSNKIIDYY